MTKSDFRAMWRGQCFHWGMTGAEADRFELEVRRWLESKSGSPIEADELLAVVLDASKWWTKLKPKLAVLEDSSEDCKHVSELCTCGHVRNAHFELAGLCTHCLEAESHCERFTPREK